MKSTQPMQPDQTLAGFAQVNQTRVYYEISGSGPPLVLIPGYTLDTRMWDEQVAGFAPHYRVLRYDLRGSGQSAMPSAEAYTYHEDLKALLEHLEIERAHVLGLSLGGAVAVDFALAYPQAVETLILADVSGLGGYEWPAVLDGWFHTITDAAHREGVAAGKQAWLNTAWFTPARQKPQVAARLGQILDDYSGWHFLHDNPVHLLEPPANQRLGEIRAPTLVMAGDRDLDFYNLPIAERLHQGITGAQKVVLRGVGHMCNMEDAQSFNRAVLTFLANHK